MNLLLIVLHFLGRLFSPREAALVPIAGAPSLIEGRRPFACERMALWGWTLHGISPPTWRAEALLNHALELPSRFRHGSRR